MSDTFDVIVDDFEPTVAASGDALALAFMEALQTTAAKWFADNPGVFVEPFDVTLKLYPDTDSG